MQNNPPSAKNWYQARTLYPAVLSKQERQIDHAKDTEIAKHEKPGSARTQRQHSRKLQPVPTGTTVSGLRERAGCSASCSKASLARAVMKSEPRNLFEKVR
jgi:hypothetical protein